MGNPFSRASSADGGSRGGQAVVDSRLGDGDMSWSAVGINVAMLAVEVAVAVWLVRKMMKMANPHREDAAIADKMVGRWEARLQHLGRLPPGAKLNLTSYEKLAMSLLVDPDDIHVTFNSIGGLKAQIQELQEIAVLPMRRPELFNISRLTVAPMGVLLYGKPGTGKTMLAKAIAKESGACFLNLNTALLINKYYGESQKILHGMFGLARKLAPSVIFCDEIDGLLSARDSGRSDEFSMSIKTQFMTLWDGLSTGVTAGNSRFRVLVVGASNRPYAIDPAVLRRMPRAIEIPLPGLQQRASILSVMLRGEALAPDFNLRWIAEATPGFSGSDLRELCKAAAMGPVRDYLAEEQTGLQHPQPRHRGFGTTPVGTSEAVETGPSATVAATVADAGDVGAADGVGAGAGAGIGAGAGADSGAQAFSTAQSTPDRRCDMRVDATGTGMGMGGGTPRAPFLRPLATADFERSLSQVRPTGEKAVRYFMKPKEASD